MAKFKPDDLHKSTDTLKDGCRARVLPLLFKLSKILDESENMSQAMGVLLQIMESNLGMLRGMVNLYHRETGKIYIHESLGLTEEEERRGVYQLGEGITGKVVESGEPIVVPKIEEEPDFLNRTGSIVKEDNRSISFICVPIMRGKKVLGTINAEKYYSGNDILKRDLEILTIIATMTAHAVELFMLEKEERIFWVKENKRLHAALQEKYNPDNIIGNSKPMQEVNSMVARIANTKTTVLILGESGVGKELVANAIHYNSDLAAGPFVKFNCAALPENLIESEIFGHEKGAFTGANNMRVGRFEEANGGTIFLDEIGELSVAMQTKLLRVLQERTFERVGGNKEIKVTIRVITATNRDLPEMVKNGEFREDLFYRLNVFPITIPSLRERGSDIITLAEYFLTKFAGDNGKERARLSTPAMEMLMNYNWPGNVRELENVIERAVILSDDNIIHGCDLPHALQNSNDAKKGIEVGIQGKLDALAREMIIEVLKDTRGNISKTARELRITRHSLMLRMKKLDIDNRKYRKIN